MTLLAKNLIVITVQYVAEMTSVSETATVQYIVAKKMCNVNQNYIPSVIFASVD